MCMNSHEPGQHSLEVQVPKVIGGAARAGVPAHAQDSRVEGQNVVKRTLKHGHYSNNTEPASILGLSMASEIE